MKREDDSGGIEDLNGGESRKQEGRRTVEGWRMIRMEGVEMKKGDVSAGRKDLNTVDIKKKELGQWMVENNER